MKEFFKDVTNFVRDIPTLLKGLIVGICVLLICLILRKTVKMFYNKDKVKWTFAPIIGIAILVALTVFLCVA